MPTVVDARTLHITHAHIITHMIVAFTILHHCSFNALDWETPGSHPAVRQEPRRGARAALRCTVCCGGTIGNLVVYCLHLEVFCGMLARMRQFADALTDARHVLQRHGASTRIAIMGDLNTMAHGIARLSPRYCCDGMRLRSMGLYEAQVWDRHILQNVGGRPSAALRSFGLPADVCDALVNPGTLPVLCWCI